MDTRKAFVYKILNIQNGKFYIGVSINPQKRFAMHKSIAKNGNNCHYLHHAMIKFINNIDEIFKLIVLEEHHSEEQAYKREIELIKYYRDNNIPIYNESEGGDRGPILFGEKNGFYGKKHSKETLDALSEKNKGKFAGEKNYFYGKSFSGENHPLFGTKRPQNVLDALSKTHRGKIIPEELRKKWSKNRKGKFSGENNPMFGKIGEQNPNHGVSDDEAIEIYKMYHEKKYLIKDILKIINTSESTISRIINCKDRFSWLSSYKK